MKQTNSAISMLIKAYKSVLTNCFRKEFLLMGGGKRYSDSAKRPAKKTLYSLLPIIGISLLPISTAQAAFTPLVNGIPINSIDGLGQGATVNDSSILYNDVNVVITKNTSNTTNRTTTAFNIGNGETTTFSGNVSIINTIPLEGRYYKMGPFQTSAINNNNALYVQGNSTVVFDENTENVFIAALGDEASFQQSAAISAKNTEHSKKGSNTITVQGQKVRVIGTLDVGNTDTTNLPEGSKNTINLILSSKDSFWYGDQSGESEDNSINLTLANGGEWIYENIASIQNLTLIDGGVVNLADSDVKEKLSATITDDISGTTINLTDYYFNKFDDTRHHVTINNLKGSGGIFKADLQFVGNNRENYGKYKYDSDWIEVTDSSESGVHYVEFDAVAAKVSSMQVGDKLYFAQLVDGNASFITNHDGKVNNADEVYDFVYGTQSETLEDGVYWYYTRLGNEQNEYQPFLKGAAFASYSLATEMDRFNDRRGESRYVSDTDDGLWVRYAYTDLGWDNAFEMDKHMVQLGYDRQFAEAYGKHYFGVSFDYTNADIDINGVSGDNDAQRYAMNLYYTWLADNGVYADFVIKGGVIDSDYDVKNASGAKIGSDLEQWYYGVSAETGYKYTFANQIFVEPQAQLQLLHLEGDRFTSDGGVKAKVDDTNSLIGRVGFRAGYDFSLSRDLPDSSVYIKADVLHEFNGDKEFKLQGRTTSYADEFSGTDTWYDAGIGIDLSVTDNTKLWVDAEHIFGADYDSTWQVNAGARYEF